MGDASGHAAREGGRVRGWGSWGAKHLCGVVRGFLLCLKGLATPCCGV